MGHQKYIGAQHAGIEKSEAAECCDQETRADLILDVLKQNCLSLLSK